jgi:hypothetical protein
VPILADGSGGKESHPSERRWRTARVLVDHWFGRVAEREVVMAESADRRIVAFPDDWDPKEDAARMNCPVLVVRDGEAH